MSDRAARGISLEAVEALAEGLPGVSVSARYGNRTWVVGKAHFAWERPFSKADVKRLGSDPVPAGPIVALAVDDLAEKEAVLAAGHAGVFTIEHFAGYAAVLVQLDVVDPGTFEELLEDAWLSVAPADLAASYLEGRDAQ